MLSKVVEKSGLGEDKTNMYIPANMSKDWFYESYIKLVKVLGNQGDAKKKLGEVEIKMILGNSDSEVLENLEKPITREQVANIIGVFIAADPKESSINQWGFNDWEKVNDLYKKRINNLKRKGLFRGRINYDNSISAAPKEELTKVEAVVLISRLYNYF